jgi:hypothetical protein
MDWLTQSSGPVFTEDDRTNLYHLNELYGNIGKYASDKIREDFKVDIPVTSGIWGGTYLIADKYGKSKRRIWRFYSIINLPQNTQLDNHQNLEKFVSLVCDGFVGAFRPYDIELELKMWGGKLPFTNSERPNTTLHMEDNKKRINWMRAFFVWNKVPWEESVIYDSVRLTKELKQSLDFDKGPTMTDTKEIKFLMQDVVITYRTLENACSPDFVEHAEPIINEITQNFMLGLFDPEKIKELYMMIFNNRLVYGFEEALEAPYGEAGLDIHRVEDWPSEKINWVPPILKKKLIPPIQNLFAGFKQNIESS